MTAAFHALQKLSQQQLHICPRLLLYIVSGPYRKRRYCRYLLIISHMRHAIYYWMGKIPNYGVKCPPVVWCLYELLKDAKLKRPHIHRAWCSVKPSFLIFKRKVCLNALEIKKIALDIWKVVLHILVCTFCTRVKNKDTYSPERSILCTIKLRKYSWFGHTLSRKFLLKDVIERNIWEIEDKGEDVNSYWIT